MLRQCFPESEAEAQTRKLLRESGTFLKEMGHLAMEENMNQRTKSLWVPAFVMLAAYTLLFVVFVRLGGFAADPVLLLSGKVLLLILFGAVGAWWARSLGATRTQRLLVGVAPALMTLVTFLIAFPVHAVQSGRSLQAAGDGQALEMVVSGILIPAAALLLGAWPFLKDAQRKPGAGSGRLAGA